MQSPFLKAAELVGLQGCFTNSPPTEPEESAADNGKQTPSKNTSALNRHSFVSITASSLFPNTRFTNPESLPSFQDSFIQFIQTYYRYSDTKKADLIRAQEYYHLSLSNTICLDYIGIGLFSYWQIQSQQISSNPLPSTSVNNSSENPCFFSTICKSVSLKQELLNNGSQEESSDLESRIRKRIMGFLKISPDDYSMVFTVNKSSAFKLLAESYPFQSNKKLLTVYDYESEALEAMVNTSERRKAQIFSAEFKWPRLRVHSEKLRKLIHGGKKEKKKNKGLFVFPLQSRMSGASYSYQWMSIAQENGWHVLLDCCALGPKDMASFGLSLISPDFVICSFYKVFGNNPTGFGCLFVKKSTLPILEDCIGIGIVSLVPPKKSNFDFLIQDSSWTETELEQASESQNESIQPIICSDEQEDVECRCLDQMDSLGLMLISSRGRFLINWLVNAIMKIEHPNRLDGFPLVRIYGPRIRFDRGPALSFNIYDWKGEKVEPILVQKLADRNNITLSIGFLQNIWFSAKYEKDKAKIIEMNKREDKNKKSEQGIAVVSIALSFLVNFEDIYKLWTFIAQFLDADFVEKERWRYTALNQKTVEV